MKYVQVVVNAKLDKALTYAWPDNLPAPQFGMVVLVPFKNSQKLGIVLDEGKSLEGAKQVKRLLFSVPLLTERERELAYFIRKHYFVTLSEALFAELPSHLGDLTREIELVEAKLKESVRAKEFSFSERIKESFQNLPALTPSQERVFNSLREGAHLILGVTGSGKTEIYIRKAAEILKEGGEVLILVPEISLTPQTHLWFQRRLKVPVFRYHSQLKRRERALVWWLTKKGIAKVIVGSRSAVLLPFKNLKLIVVDEEQDASYKQEQSPYYDTYELALFFLERDPSLVLLFGSATPSLIIYAKALRGDLKLHRLKERFLGQVPKMVVVNTKNESHLLSLRLRELIAENLAKKRQAVLFLDRRGERAGLFCASCFSPILCSRCEIPLVYHRLENKLLCHHCGLRKNFPKECPVCKSSNFHSKRFGTENLEREVKRFWPKVRVFRLDRDIIKKYEIEKIYRAFLEHKIDVLVGTRMITKGWDIPAVDLVGIIDADLSLFFPDYRARERTYELLTQVAGRAGRRGEGIVVIQTRTEDHPVISAVIKQDFENFAKKELFLRKRENFPPFCEIIRLLIKHKEPKKALEKAQKIRTRLLAYLDDHKELSSKIEIFGPTTCFFEKIASRYRLQVVVKAKSIPEDLEALFREINQFSFCTVIRNPDDLL